MSIVLLVLKILGGLLAALLLIVCVILALPVKVILLRNEETPFQIRFQVLWFTFGGEEKPKSPLAKAFAKVFGTDGKKPKTPRPKKEKPFVGAENVTEIVGIVMELLGRVVRRIPRCRVEKLLFRSISAGPDAAQVAMDYGLICAAVYPLIGFIESHLRVSPRGKQVEIGCDYDAEEPTLTVDIRLSLRIAYLAAALGGVLFRHRSVLLEKETGKHEE